MLTAAVRDLHRGCPGDYLTDVRTSCPEIWKNNPYLTPLDKGDPEVEVIDCHYPLIQQSNVISHHFVHGYIEFLNQRLEPGKRLQPTAFKADLHLSETERSEPSAIASLCGENIPFWIVVAGGKYDYTIKWWQARRYQSVIDLFRNKLLFVQVGEAKHFHPELHGVVDLRGKTDLRQLIRLVHHAQGVLCPVTFLMHLAAAWERPCVVVAGGREPPQWEAYPFHQFIHTVGALPCCATGGCWKSRTLPLGDGDRKDKPESLCVDVVNGLPHCMDLITPEQVVQRIETYVRGGIARYLEPREARLVKPHCRPALRTLFGLESPP